MGICLSSMVFDTNRVSALNSIKRKVSDEDNEHRPANVASTAGLQMLLQQQFLRERFRDFVSAHWVPANDNNDFSSFSACDPRLIALNCIEFWTDVQDFSFIEHSPFQQYRACYIYEKYIMHGAANLVPLSTNAVSECTDSIYCKDQSTQYKLDSTLFACAEAEVLDFLIAEVFSTFESTTLSVATKHSQGTDKMVHMKGSSISRRKSLFRSPDRTALANIMEKILMDPSYLAVFKQYMIDVESESILYAYNETIEIKERLNTLISYSEKIEHSRVDNMEANLSIIYSQGSTSDSKLNHEKSCKETSSGEASLQIFLHYINTFYDTYLSIGAQFRLRIPDATFADFLRRISHCKITEPDVLQCIEIVLFEQMIQFHLDKFLNSAPYRGVVRSGRGSILVIARNLEEPIIPDVFNQETVDLAKSKNVINHEPELTTSSVNNTDLTLHGTPSVQGFGQSDMNVSPSTSSVVDTSSTSTSVTGPEIFTKVELKNFIHSEQSVILGRYLKKYDVLPLMHFYQSSCRFQNTKHRSNLEQIAECQLIFARYVSRNSDEVVGLPTTVRSKIVGELFQPSPLIFKTAADLAFTFIHDKYWIGFKESIYRSAVHQMLIVATETVDNNVASTKKNLVVSTSSNCETVLDSKIHHESHTFESELNTGIVIPHYLEDSALNFDARRKLIEAQNPVHSDAFYQFAIMTYPPTTDEKNAKKTPGVNYIASQKQNLIASENSKCSRDLGIVEQNKSKKDGAHFNYGTTIDEEKQSNNSGTTIVAKLDRENCREFRRRSLNREKDPLRLSIAAVVGKNNNQPKSRRNSITTFVDVNSERDQSNVIESILENPPGFRSFKDSQASRLIRVQNKPQLLRNILCHPHCCSIFKSHLEKASSSQTILFLLEIDEYLLVPNPVFQKTRARKIFNKYLHTLSIMPVPISSATRNQIKIDIETAGPGIFKRAHEDVIDYVLSCQLNGFLSTPEITGIMHLLKEQETQSISSRRRSSLALSQRGQLDPKSLRHILQSPVCTRFFKDFCQRIFISESLFFYLDVENYTNLPGTDYMRRTAYKICRKYVFDNAKLQVNLSHVSTTEIIKNLPNPDRTLFKRAQLEIFKLLEMDALPKFVKGQEYEAMLQAIDASPTLGNTDGGYINSFQRAIRGLTSSIKS